MPTLPSELNQTIGWVLAAQNTDRRLASHVERGRRAVTEQYAYPYLGKALDVLDSPEQRTGFIRGMGLMVGLTHQDWTRLGRSFSSLCAKTYNHTPDSRPEGVGAKVQLLPICDLEQATTVIGGLLGRCKQKDIPVNVFDLVATMTWWKTTNPSADRTRRNQIVFDYFTAPASDQKLKEVPTETEK